MISKTVTMLIVMIFSVIVVPISTVIPAHASAVQPGDLNTWTAEAFPAVSGFSSGEWTLSKSGPSESGIVTQTKHVRLGCKMDIPFQKNIHEEQWDYFLGFWTYIAGLDLDLDGTIHLEMDMGADISISYDPADFVPGGILPVSITYTPTNDSGPEISFSVTSDVDIEAAGLYAIPLLHYQWTDTTFIQTSGDFIAPLGPDMPPALVPLTGDKFWVKDPVFGINVISLQLAGLLQMIGTPPGDVSGLGGAASGILVAGGWPTGELATRPVLEWQHPGDTIVVDIQLGNTPNLDITLVPVTQWLGTWVDAAVIVDVFDVLSVLFGGGIPVPIMSGDLGPDFIATGLPDAFADTFGGKVIDRVADGYIPNPLLKPEVATIDLNSPSFTLGSVAANLEMGMPCDMYRGDIIFGRSGPSVYGFWSHAGILLDDAPAGTLLSHVGLVESTSYGRGDPLPGVRISNVNDFWDEMRAIAFKRLGTESWRWWNKDDNRDAVIDAAITYALAEQGKPYDWEFRKYNEDAQYCSELVWHAYVHGPPQYAEILGINLDSNKGLAVFPDDLFINPKLDAIYTWSPFLQVNPSP